MYITINNIIGEKRIDLSYSIDSSKEAQEGPHSTEVAVFAMLRENIQYEIEKPRTIIDDISSDKKLILSKTYTERELLSTLEGMISFNQFVNDEMMIELLRRISCRVLQK